jgi:hypothetical protein
LEPYRNETCPKAVGLRGTFEELLYRKTDYANWESEQRLAEVAIRVGEEKLRAIYESPQTNDDDVYQQQENIRNREEDARKLREKTSTAKTISMRKLAAEAQLLLDEIKHWISERKKTRPNASSVRAKDNFKTITTASKTLTRTASTQAAPKLPVKTARKESKEHDEHRSLPTDDAASTWSTLDECDSESKKAEQDKRDKTGAFPFVSRRLNTGDTAQGMSTRKESGFQR